MGNKVRMANTLVHLSPHPSPSKTISLYDFLLIQKLVFNFSWIYCSWDTYLAQWAQYHYQNLNRLLKRAMADQLVATLVETDLWSLMVHYSGLQWATALPWAWEIILHFTFWSWSHGLSDQQETIEYNTSRGFKSSCNRGWSSWNAPAWKSAAMLQRISR